MAHPRTHRRAHRPTPLMMSTKTLLLGFLVALLVVAGFGAWLAH